MLEYYSQYYDLNQLVKPYNYGIYFSDSVAGKRQALVAYEKKPAIRFFPESLDYGVYINNIRKEVG